MSAWLTSDTHFGHENIIHYCGRPYKTVGEMNYDIMRRWNDVVSPTDTVYHLGDFAMGLPDQWPAFRQRLHGRVVLVRGNHDRDEPFMCNVVGMEEVVDNVVVEIDGVRCWLNHYPPAGTDWHPAKKVRPAPPEAFDLALCGHIHEKWTVAAGCVNVGVDRWGFRPISVDDALTARSSSAT